MARKREEFKRKSPKKEKRKSPKKKKREKRSPKNEPLKTKLQTEGKTAEN